MHLFKRSVLAALVLSAWPAAAETLKVSSYLPPKHTFNVAIEAWGKELTEKSGGRLVLELYPAGQLGPVNRQFDLARTGAADLAIVLHSATPGRFPLTEIAGLPLSHPSAGDKSAVTSKRLTELSAQYLQGEHPGTRILWMAVTPPLKINLAKADPSSLDAFKGLRIRYAGQVFQQVLEKLGATPLAVQPAEVNDSLSKGIIDGAMFPFEAVQAFDLGPVLKYSMEPGIAPATFALVMNEQAYKSLPEDLQKLITETTGPSRAASFGASWDASEEAARKYMTEKHKVKIVTLSQEQEAKFRDLVRPIIKEQIKAVDNAGKPASQFYEAYVK